MNARELLKDKKRIVVKVGSSSLTHPETGRLNLNKLERLVRELCDLSNSGKEIVLVSSGAIAVGVAKLGISQKPVAIAEKQGCAAVGQAQLMMIYQKMFSEYNHVAAQVLMTKNTMLDNLNRKNAENTFQQLLKWGVIPIVNENDTVSTYEMQFGDNDTLSAIVSGLIRADLLILLSDIDGLYTDDPNQNANSKLIHQVDEIDDDLIGMAKESTGSGVGTGGMATKITAAKIATASGADMVIANGKDPEVLQRILDGEDCGTLFLSNPDEYFFLLDYIEDKY